MTTVEREARKHRSTSVSDSLVIARRGLKHIRRQPEALTDATIQPIMFVLLFAFVFGGAIRVPGGGSCREFLMGGIFAQMIIFGCFGVAMAPVYDRTNGAIARGTVLAGHSLASLLMSLTGLIIGWRIHSGVLDALAAFGLMIAFSFAMIWVGVLLGSIMKSPESVQGVAFVATFPITFIASTFVPTSTLPEPLKTFAEWNPVSSLACGSSRSC